MNEGDHSHLEIVVYFSQWNLISFIEEVSHWEQILSF